MKPSLQLFDRAGGRLLFSADGNWLHPLFELEAWLAAHPQQPDTLFLCDKIIGKAAAVLLLTMGIRHCHGGVVSNGAVFLLKRFRACVSYDILVARIGCRTETLVDEHGPLAEAYQLIAQRRAIALQKSMGDFPPAL